MSLTPLTNIHSRLSPRIFNKNRNDLKGVLRGQGDIDLRKNLKSKISCQTSFNLVELPRTYTLGLYHITLWHSHSNNSLPSSFYQLTQTQSQIMMIWLSSDTDTEPNYDDLVTSDDTLSNCALTSAKMCLLFGTTMLFLNRSKGNEEVIECRHCF